MTRASKFLGDGVYPPITKFLPLIDPHLHPRTRPEARLVLAVPSFRNQPFKALLPYGADQAAQACIQNNIVCMSVIKNQAAPCGPAR